MSSHRIRVLLVLSLIAAFAVSAASSQSQRTPLRVSLFPWVPAPESYVSWVEKDFEATYPDIDLLIRPVKMADTTDLSYDIDAATKALQGTAEAQDLVEIDTVILGALVQRGVVAEQTLPPARFMNAAKTAVRVNGATYGIPHWTCGYFVISTYKSVASSARNASSLVAALAGLGTAHGDVVGDLDGSWDSVSVYLDAVRDSERKADLTQAVKVDDLLPSAEMSLGLLSAACNDNGKSRCGEDGADLFAAGKADALIGYSERINPILAKGAIAARDLYLASAPLGNGDAPTLFTDAFVLSKNCVGACRSAAQKLTTYLVSDRTFERTLMADDLGPTAVPRYLLPSTTSAFKSGRLTKDPIYQQLQKEIRDAVAFPNQGVPEARDRGVIRTKIKKLLGL